MSGDSLLEAVRSYLAAEMHAEKCVEPDAERERARQRVQQVRRHLDSVVAAHGKAVEVHPPVFRRILVAIDDSEQATWALDFAGGLAAGLSAQVKLMHVVSMPIPYTVEVVYAGPGIEEDLCKAGEQLLLKAQTHLPKTVKSERLLCKGRPSDAIIAAAGNWGADLIVMGTHGRGRLAGFLLGSTAKEVLRHAACPVLAVAHPPGNSETTSPNPQFAGGKLRTGGDDVSDTKAQLD